MRNQLPLVFLTMLLVVGCTGSPKIGEVAVTTPEHYSENKVLFAMDADQGTRRNLLHGYEIVRQELLEVGASERLAIERDRYIEKLSPLGVIVRGVRLPDDGTPNRDIAVVVDIVTAGEESVTSLVVFYQRNVPGGQMLNFKDLLVYYDPEWDGVSPPWFRVRVLEVNAERNERARAFLTEANKLSGSLAGVVPHPVLPSVGVAIEAAKLILGNKRNKVIVDYQVQFYSPTQIKGAATALTPLRKGEWLVVGRAAGATSAFWNEQLTLDVRTEQLYRTTDAEPEGPGGGVIEVPYVAVVLMVADAAVPKHILDRSQALIQLLDSPTERANFDSLASTATQLTSALLGYKTERMVKKYTTDQDFRDLVDLLKRYDASARNNAPILLQSQVRTLVRLVNELVEDESFGTVEAILVWWDDGGGSDGSFEKDPSALHGAFWRT